MWVAALFIGFLAGFLLAKRAPPKKAVQSGVILAADKNNYLNALRRELANCLMRREPDRYCRLLDRLQREQEELDGWSAEAAQGQLAALCERYPSYRNFDLIGTREHILYDDAFSDIETEEIAEHYRSIVLFQMLQSRLNEDWRYISALREDDVKHAAGYASKLADTNLKRRIRSAMDEFYKHGGSRMSGYETDEYSIVSVPHTPEIRYGIHFKKTDEYALYGFFDHDDRHYESYYRSDQTFKEETYLDVLYFDESSDQ